MSVSYAIGEFATKTSAAQISDELRSASLVALVDMLGCTVAGSRTDVGKIVSAHVSAESFGPATIVGTTKSVSPSAAAFANGAAAHALDLDDVLWTQYGHPSVVVGPALLAVAEQIKASGKDVVDAYVIAIQVISKLSRHVNPSHYESGWHATSTIGVLGATAALTRLMKLTPEQAAMAIGIAVSEANGVRRNFGSMTKPFHAGNAARAAVVASSLAAMGMTSDRLAIEGRFGWYEMMQARSRPDAAELARSLADGWDVVDPGIVVKRYGACGCTHCALDAMVDLKQEHAFRPEDIERIDCFSHPLAKKVLLHSRPNTGLEGKFSMEHAMAVAAVVGLPGLEHFEDEWVQNPVVRSVVPRVRFEIDDKLAVTELADAVPARVAVTLKGGKYVESTVTIPVGDPRRPMSESDLARKFHSCTAGILTPSMSTQAFESIRAMADAPDVSTVLKGLAENVAIAA